MKEISVGLISLGCPKNQVDAEMMLARLEKENFKIVDDVDGAEVVIVNTCGFIDEAKKEAIENILDMTELKKDGVISHVVVTGCLAERYKDEIMNEISEVDAVIGIGENGNIAKVLKDVVFGKKVSAFPPKEELPLDGQRSLLSPESWAYLKIAEGCSNCCTYCAIPLIRGKFRSRKMENILEEAKQLAVAGVKEIVLVAQDTTRYGEDIYGENSLAKLLDELCEVEGIEWIRILYCYPERVTDELLQTMASQPKVVHYIDLPLQHCDEKILSAMNRTGDEESLRKLIEKIRSYMPDIIIRTTFITGFPSESEEEFEKLAQFVKDMEFDRLGCFAYSPQEGTPAAKLEDNVDEQVKIRRGELIMEEQFRISQKKNEDLMGKTFKIMVQGYDDYSDCYYGRSYMDAPEIDTLVYFTSPNPYVEGDFVDVVLFDVHDYDLIGKEVL